MIVSCESVARGRVYSPVSLNLEVPVFPSPRDSGSSVDGRPVSLIRPALALGFKSLFIGPSMSVEMIRWSVLSMKTYGTGSISRFSMELASKEELPYR
jgi:hypothetical protein